MNKISNKFWTLILISFLDFTPLSVQANAIQEITSNQAQVGNVLLKVYPGFGHNVVVPDGETIENVWLDDPSQINFSFDAQRKLIHFKQHELIKFPSLPRTQKTLVTIVTNKNVYIFPIQTEKGTPSNHITKITNSSASSLTYSPLWSIKIEKGLDSAVSRGLISIEQGNEHLSTQVNQFLVLVKQGKSIEEAAQQAGISIALIQKLEELGTMIPDELPSITPHIEEE